MRPQDTRRPIEPTANTYDDWFEAIEVRSHDGTRQLVPSIGNDLISYMLLRHWIGNLETGPECWAAVAYITRPTTDDPAFEEKVITNCIPFTDGVHVLNCEDGRKWIDERMEHYYGPDVAGPLWALWEKADSHVEEGR